MSANMVDLFQPLLDHISYSHAARSETDSAAQQTQSTSTTRTSFNSYQLVTKEEEMQEVLSTAGAKIKVKWTSEEIGDSGWSPGWYLAVVQSYYHEDDLVTVSYPSEPGCTYQFELSNFIKKRKVKILKAVF